MVSSGVIDWPSWRGDAVFALLGSAAAAVRCATRRPAMKGQNRRFVLHYTPINIRDDDGGGCRIAGRARRISKPHRTLCPLKWFCGKLFLPPLNKGLRAPAL
jgi:hypothetical protein